MQEKLEKIRFTQWGINYVFFTSCTQNTFCHLKFGHKYGFWFIFHCWISRLPYKIVFIGWVDFFLKSTSWNPETEQEKRYNTPVWPPRYVRSAGDARLHPPLIFADQLTQEPLKHFSSPWLTLSEPRGVGQIMTINYYTPPPPNFQTFRHSSHLLCFMHAFFHRHLLCGQPATTSPFIFKYPLKTCPKSLLALEIILNRTAY